MLKTHSQHFRVYFMSLPQPYLLDDLCICWVSCTWYIYLCNEPKFMLIMYSVEFPWVQLLYLNIFKLFVCYRKISEVFIILYSKLFFYFLLFRKTQTNKETKYSIPIFTRKSFVSIVAWMEKSESFFNLTLIARLGVCNLKKKKMLISLQAKIKISNLCKDKTQVTKTNIFSCFLRGNIHDVMAKVLDCSLEVSVFELYLHHYVHFQINTLGKGMNLLIPSATLVLLQG